MNSEEVSGALPSARAGALRAEPATQSQAEPLVPNAVEMCEAFTGQVLIAREATEEVAPRVGWQRLGKTPVRSVNGVEGIDRAEYAIDIDANGDGWIRLQKPVVGVVIRYEAGLAADLSSLPSPLRMGIERLEAWQQCATRPDEPPAAVSALWRPWRRLRLS